MLNGFQYIDLRSFPPLVHFFNLARVSMEIMRLKPHMNYSHLRIHKEIGKENQWQHSVE